MDFKIAAEQIFLASIESVLPNKLIRKQVFIQGSSLCIASLQFSLDAITRIFVTGAGKASALMAMEIENILGDRITGGHIIVKYGHGRALKYIHVHEAAHPIPDANGYLATQKILEMTTKAKEDDLIICLLSGGGSALLTDFPEGGTLSDIIIINDLLLKSGADIREINAVRKHLSKVKGGQLAKASYPVKLVSLILSDVIGDPLDVIASGPTVPDPTTFADAIAILKRYNLVSKISQHLIDHLKKGAEGFYAETPKPGDAVFKNTTNIIIGSNKIALEAAGKKALALGLYPLIINSVLEGDTTNIAGQLLSITLRFQIDDAIKKPCCLLFGGETTINVNGIGTGGRNQHLALQTALLLKNHKGITLLSGGTDGSDGPTATAGAVVDSTTIDRAVASGIYPEKYLNNFDSFHFFELAGGHVITGPTMTNVMDVIVIIIEEHLAR